eukprot:jgi/Chrzof1/10518/Cz05g01220.t1
MYTRHGPKDPFTTATAKTQQPSSSKGVYVLQHYSLTTQPAGTASAMTAHASKPDAISSEEKGKDLVVLGSSILGYNKRLLLLTRYSSADAGLRDLNHWQQSRQPQPAVQALLAGTGAAAVLQQTCLLYPTSFSPWH